MCLKEFIKYEWSKIEHSATYTFVLFNSWRKTFGHGKGFFATVNVTGKVLCK